MLKESEERMMTKGDFMLVELKDAGIMPVYDGDGQLLTFATGTEADRAASKWTTKLGNKVQPRRINDANWRERERTREHSTVSLSTR